MKRVPFHDVRERAESGDAFAQVLYGFLLEHGLRMAPNKNLAEVHYRKAAQQGFAPGQYALSFLVADTNPDEGIAHLRTAAESGYGPAQYALGYLHQDGELIDRDNAVALKWLEKAANQDYVPAFLHLASMYAEGISVIKDEKKSISYLRKAARAGDPAAEFELGEKMLREGGQETDVEEGLHLIWSSAMKSYPFANEFLADMYAEGLYSAPRDLRLRDLFLSRSELREDEYY